MLKYVVPLTDILLTEDLCARSRLRSTIIQEYAELYCNGVLLPPLDLFETEEGNLLVDGFHRFEAAKLAKLSTIDAFIHKGSKRDALLFAVQQNDLHGIRRTRADKIKCVQLLLADSECSGWSVDEIAKHCKTSRDLVREVRGKAKPGQIRQFTRMCNGKTQQVTMRLSDESVTGGWPRTAASDENPWQCAQRAVAILASNKDSREVWLSFGKLVNFSEDDAISFLEGLRKNKPKLLNRMRAYLKGILCCTP